MTSKGEEKIVSILKKEKISFEREKQFIDMKKHGNKLRFDFYIPEKNVALEYEGQQHFYQVKPFQKERKDFLKQQEYDRHKISYCLIHNIKLYIIPYWELDNIKNSKDLFKEKYKAKTKWHNDIIYKNYNKKRD